MNTAVSLPISVLLALLGGVAMWLANEPVAIWPLFFIAISCLWILVRGRRWYSGFGWSFLWAFVFFYFLFDWASSAAGTWLAQIGLTVVEALYIAVLGMIWTGLRRWPVRWRFSGWQISCIVLAIATWLAMEQLRSAWPLGGMPWGTIAFGMVDSPLVRLAPYGSTQLVGAMTLFVGLLLGFAIERIAHGQYLHSISAVVIGAIVVFAPAMLPIGVRPESRISAGIVQGNVPDVEKLTKDQSRALEVTKNHVAAAKSIIDEPMDVMIFPESTSDRDIRVDDKSGELIAELAMAAGVPLLLGTQEYSDETRENHYIVYNPDGQITDIYVKQHPVPFGEYVPFRDLIRHVTTAVDRVSTDMVAGEDPALLTVDFDDRSIVVGAVICFEVAYTEIVAETMRGGAELLIVPTNNATFAGSGEPEQQFAMSRFRAVENAKTTVQVATSGITGVIEPNGVVTFRTDYGVADARVVDLALNTRVTFSAASEVPRRLIGYVVGVLGGIVGLSALAVSSRDRQVPSNSPRKRKS